MYLNIFENLFNYAKCEYHPFLIQRDLVDFCRENLIAFQAFSSLGTSDINISKSLVENKTVNEVARAYSKSPAQILLKWSVQQNICKLT
jgi:diketogulonate reductase-like aldo/keto reductase